MTAIILGALVVLKLRARYILLTPTFTYTLLYHYHIIECYVIVIMNVIAVGVYSVISSLCYY